MTEAQDWAIWRWLFEKRCVRRAADEANTALAAAEQKVKDGWGDGPKNAYAELPAQDSARKGRRESAVDPEVLLTVRKTNEDFDEAERVRLEAEATFDEADRLLSAAIAREGTFKAIEAWTLREKAIRKAEAAGKRSAAASSA